MKGSEAYAKRTGSAALYDRIAHLEDQLAQAQAALMRSRERDREASTSPSVEVELDERGYLLIHLPGAHTLRWALGLTQHEMAMAMKALTEVLRSRRPDRPNPIGTAGAPTIADLQALAQGRTATRLPPSARQIMEVLTLEDLGL